MRFIQLFLLLVPLVLCLPGACSGQTWRRGGHDPDDPAFHHDPKIRIPAEKWRNAYERRRAEKRRGAVDRPTRHRKRKARRLRDDTLVSIGNRVTIPINSTNLDSAKRAAEKLVRKMYGSPTDSFISSGGGLVGRTKLPSSKRPSAVGTYWVTVIYNTTRATEARLKRIRQSQRSRDRGLIEKRRATQRRSNIRKALRDRPNDPFLAPYRGLNWGR